MSENGSPHPTDVSPAAPTPMRTSHETTENMIPETPAEALSLQGRHWQAVATTTTETTSGTITRLPVPALTPHYASSLVRNVTTASVGALFGFASFSARPTSQQLTPVKRRRFDASLTDRKERDEVKGQKSARNAADSEEEADVPREDACGTKRNEAGAVSENNLIQPATNQSSAHRGMLPSSSSQEARGSVIQLVPSVTTTSTESAPPPSNTTVKVFLRQRPSEPALPRAVHLSSANSVTFRPTVYNTGSGSVSASQEVEAVYSFDEVFAENAQDEMVFRKTTLPLLDRLMKSSTPMDELVLAYGPSGSGKTHTLTGILKKTIQFLVHEAGKLGTTAPGGVRPSKWSDVEILSSPHFQEEEDDSSEESVSLWISFLEIHNDKCRDLLNPESIKGKGHPLKYDPFTKTPFLKEMTEAPIKDFKSAQDLVARVIAARRTMETNVNKMSSRGHLITTIKVLRFCGQRGIKPRISRISIADLAGSENAKRTGAEGATQTEAGHINKSLYFLSDCVSKLVQNQKSSRKETISYRSCQLTNYLQPFLRTGRVSFLFHVDPTNEEQTKAVLDFSNKTCELVTYQESTTFAAATAASKKRKRGVGALEDVAADSAFMALEMRRLASRAALAEQDREALVARNRDLEGTIAHLQANWRVVLETSSTENERLKLECVKLITENESRVRESRDKGEREQEERFERKLVTARDRIEQLEADLELRDRELEEKDNEIQQLQELYDAKETEASSLGEMLQEVRDKSRPQLDTKGRCIECISRDLRITVVNSKLMMAPVDPGSASKQASFAFSAIQTESVEHNQTDNQSSLVRTSNLSFQHDPDLVNVSTSTDPGNVHQTDASLADAELMQEDDLAKAMPNSERESQNYDVLGDYFASVNSSLVVERVMDNDDVKERIIPHFATVQTQTESAFHGRSAESQTEFMPDEARTQTSDMIGGHADKDTQTLKGDISCANEGVHSNGRSHDISATDLSDVKYEEGYKQSPVQRRSSMIIQPSKSNRRRRRLSNKPADSSVPAVAARDPIEDDEFISARQSTLENRRKSFLSSAAQYPDLHQAHRSSRVAGIAGAATKRAGKTPRIRRTVVKVALKTTNHENSSENEEPTSPPHERLSGPTRRRSSSLRIEDIGLPVVNAASRRRGALIGALQAGSRKPLDAVMGTAGVSSSVSLDASIQKLSGPLLGRKGVGKRQSGGEAVVVLAPVWRRRSNDTEKYGIGASAEPTLAVSPELENAQRVEQDSDEEEPKRKRRLRIEKSIMPVEDSPMVKPRRKRMTRK